MSLPTPVQIRNTLAGIRNSEVAPTGYMSLDVVVALLMMLVDSGGGGGGGGSSSQYQEGDPSGAAPSTGTAMLFRRADGTLKVIQGDNSDRVKVVGEMSLATGTSIIVSNFPGTQPISGTVSIGNFPATQTVSGTVSISNGFALDTTATAIRDRLPTALGANTAINSFPVTLATDGAFANAFGSTSDAAASSDTGTASHMSLLKRLLSRITAFIGLFQGTAGSPNANVVSVQGVTNGQSLPTTVVQSTSGTFTNRNGSTSGTSNTWSTLMTAQPTRTRWFLQNTSDTLIEVGYGASGADGTVVQIKAGDSNGMSIKDVDFCAADRGIIVVRCPSAASKSFLAHEII